MATVNGKTGTAELGPGIKSDAWFVGYAPAEAPRVVVAVLIVHGGVGGKTAAPIARADDRGRAAVSGVRGIVLDMEGVLHVDWSPIPGSASRRGRAGGRAASSWACSRTPPGKTRAEIAERLAGDRLRAAAPSGS